MKQALVLLILLALTALTNLDQKPVPAKAVERSRQAAKVIELAMAKPDARIPKVLLSKAVAVAVITEMKTIGLLIDSGGEGYGVVTRRFPNGNWSRPAYIHMAALQVGHPQIHVRSFNVILLFMSDKSADWFLEKGIMFDREKAPVAGPIGEIKTEQKEVVPVADVFSYIFDDGRLQSVDLKNRLKNVGISFDNKLNKATYGATLADILTDSDGKKVSRSPSEVTAFPDTVTRFFGSENSEPGSSERMKPKDDAP
jgi:lipid-binding SYLF domain-containing protein